MPSKIKLMSFQKKAYRKIKKFKGRVLFADEMGLGKTVVTIFWLKKNPDIKPVVVVCPAAAKGVWASHARRYLKLTAEVIEGRKVPKKQLPRDHSLLIINYDILTNWLTYLISIRPQALIIDECHYIKSRNTKRTIAVKKLSKRIKHILALSGTPLTNRPAELFPTLNIIKPKQFSGWLEYAFRYCKPRRTPWGWQYKGATNIRELHRTLKKSMMIRRLKKDVLKELPSKTRTVVPLGLKKKDMKNYQEAEQDIIKWLRENKSITKAKRAKKAEKLVQMGYLKRLSAELKIPLVLDWIRDFLQQSNEKLVVFGVHQCILKRIQEEFPKSVLVDGKTTRLNRQKAIKTFQHNKKTRLFIGNIQAAGTAITLTAASSLIFAELDWVPGNHTQAEDRIHRLTQQYPVNIYYLVAENTIEEKLCKIIQKKQRIVSNTLDGKKSKNYLNIYKKLEKLLLRKWKK